MHVYIYDSYVNQQKYQSVLARIETRITDLGLNGKIIRLGVMNSVFDAIENEIKNGAKTIITLGDNNLLNQAINAIANLATSNALSQKVPLGFIPIGKKNNHIAEYLGIEAEEAACNILSARRITTLDLGLANDNFFLTQASITTQGTTIEIDKNYSIEINEPGQISIINMPTELTLPKEISSNATDGILELFIKTKKGNKFLPLNPAKTSHSVFSFKQLQIFNQSKPMLIDQAIKIPTPVNVGLAKEKINMIVGRQRKY